MRHLKSILEKKEEKQRKKIGLYTELRKLFAMDRLYTVNDIVVLTGHKKSYVKSAVSMIQNPKRTIDPIEIVWKKCEDGIKRFGNPTATKICNVQVQNDER